MVRLLDGTIIHAEAPYDPQKAHEYYLRTRKLHPRQIGAKDQPATRGSRQRTFTVIQGGKAVRLNEQQLKEQRVYAAARVKNIQVRLKELHDKLQQRIRTAQKRAAAAKRPPTAAEKAQAARDAKQYRSSHQQQIKNAAKKAAAKAPAKKAAPRKKSLTTAELKTQITATKNALTAAVAKQRALNSAKPNG